MRIDLNRFMAESWLTKSSAFLIESLLSCRPFESTARAPARCFAAAVAQLGLQVADFFVVIQWGFADLANIGYLYIYIYICVCIYIYI